MNEPLLSLINPHRKGGVSALELEKATLKVRKLIATLNSASATLHTTMLDLQGRGLTYIPGRLQERIEEIDAALLE